MPDLIPFPQDRLVPFSCSSGPRKAKIAIVGEAWGEKEALAEMPFVGFSGQELTRMLEDAGLSRNECFLTNTFCLRPEENKVENLCGKKAEVGKDYLLPPLAAGKYIYPAYLPHLERLRQELEEVKPNLIVALGNTALWALLRRTGISRARGVIALGPLVPEIKVLPTFHPASVLRNWEQRVIVLADLIKAGREAAFPEVRRMERQLLVNPLLEELEEWWQTAQHHNLLAADIETKNKQITMISFATSATCGVVVPFEKKDGTHYWPSLREEQLALQFVKKVLEAPISKLFQNGLYDLQYLFMYGIRPLNCRHDTMLLHHSILPELPKGLGFLGSIYANEAEWKSMRDKKELKKDA